MVSVMIGTCIGQRRDEKCVCLKRLSYINIKEICNSHYGMFVQYSYAYRDRERESVSHVLMYILILFCLYNVLLKLLQVPKQNAMTVL